MKRFTVDCRKVRSFDDFIAATNIGFVEHMGGKWNGSLDAFSDYLSWPDDQEYELKFLEAATGARNLGHAAQAAWLREHLVTCHPSNVAEIQDRLARAEAGQGETLFDVVTKIISDNPNVRLVLQ